MTGFKADPTIAAAVLSRTGINQGWNDGQVALAGALLKRGRTVGKVIELIDKTPDEIISTMLDAGPEYGISTLRTFRTSVELCAQFVEKEMDRVFQEGGNVLKLPNTLRAEFGLKQKDS